MSNFTLDELMTHAGSDYDELPADVQRRIDEDEVKMANVGIDVEADLTATEGAEVPFTAPISVTVNRDKGAPESFSSRGAARKFVSSHPGYKVVDNGSGSGTRWTVAAKGGTSTTSVAPKVKQASTVTVAAKPASEKVDKKAIALVVYAEMEANDTLKRSTFLAEMETRTGLSAKGASSYFYRIKGGKW